jgi:sirohydrochlorin cobaltochelatase
MNRTILIVAHGSREASANREFRRIVRRFARRHPDWRVAHAFLDVVKPSIPEALEVLAKGSNRIQVLPFFLFKAKHVKKDIPVLLRAFRKRHPKIRIGLEEPLGSHPGILKLLKP